MPTITPANIQHGLNFENALKVGRKAGLGETPVPMTVFGNDQAYVVEDGVCGFAWIEIRPAKGGLVTYLKKSKQGYYSSYQKAYIFNIHDFNQSLTRKEAMAYAMAAYLCNCGYNVCANSRID